MHSMKNMDIVSHVRGEAIIQYDESVTVDEMYIMK